MHYIDRAAMLNVSQCCHYSKYDGNHLVANERKLILFISSYFFIITIVTYYLLFLTFYLLHFKKGDKK